MNKYTKFIPVFAGLLLFPGTQLYALDGSKNSSNLIGSSTSESFETISSAKMQKMYLLNDTKIFSSNSTVSAVLETQLRGTQVSIMNVEGDLCKVLTQTGNIGYVSIDMLTSQPEYIFVPDNVVMYATKDTVLKLIPSDKGESAAETEANEELQVTGSNDLKYWRVVVDGTVYYTDHSTLNTKKTSAKTVSSSSSANTANTAAATFTWNGAALNPSSGTIIGPSGKETYYNLNMSGVVSIMRSSGNSDEYWVREDGVKMLGNYVMVAANLSVHPRGSLVETSLGMGIVCDTGGFAYTNQNQLDIAVAW
jgi:hypothetical protein